MQCVGMKGNRSKGQYQWLATDMNEEGFGISSVYYHLVITTGQTLRNSEIINDHYYLMSVS